MALRIASSLYPVIALVARTAGGPWNRKKQIGRLF